MCNDIYQYIRFESPGFFVDTNMELSDSKIEIMSMSDSISFPATSSRSHDYFVESAPESRRFSFIGSPPRFSSSSTDYPRSSSARRSSVDWTWIRIDPKAALMATLEEEDRIPYERIDEDQKDEGGKSCFVLLCGVALIFALFFLIFPSSIRTFRTQVKIENMELHSFYIEEGADRTGVPTNKANLSLTTTMSIHNPATFFGVHVWSRPMDLSYSGIRVATGEMSKYFLPRKSSMVAVVNLTGSEVPLYGAAKLMIASKNSSRGVPLKLDFKIESCGYVFGKLVKAKHITQISCNFLAASKGENYINFGDDSCVYDQI